MFRHTNPTCLLGLVLIALILAGGCESAPPTPSTPITKNSAGKNAQSPNVGASRLDASVARKTEMANPTIPQEPSPFRFRDVASQAGINFVHVSGMTEEKHFPSANGSGVAFFDYDGDKKLDLYFATNNYLPLGSKPLSKNRLFRALGNDQFEDVTEKAGVGFAGFCHGVITGDLDNDGDQDLYLCNYGPNVFYLNNGNGTFRDVTAETGTGSPAWSSSGATLDFDQDGLLDFYVSNYGEWIFERDKDRFCGNLEHKIRQYCSPKEIKTVKHHLYRNEGIKDGVPRFRDVIDQVGIGRTDGHGFGVVAADLNNDGKIDLYVANDQNPAFTFINKGDGTFHDATDESGAAYDERGQAQAGMGVDAEDLDGDGLPELFKTHFKDEYNTMYRNLGDGTFFDQTPAYGIAADSLPWVGWGCVLGDFDNDGWADVFVTNGHVDDNYHLFVPPLNIPYAEPPLVHRNVALDSTPESGRRFRLSTRDVGDYVAKSHVGRGLAYGDYDDDGDLDLVINHKDGPPALLKNETPDRGHWIRLSLKGTRSNRDAIGTKIQVVLSDKQSIYRQRKGGTSMESSHDPRVLIGVGAVETIPKLKIRWPSGTETTLKNVKVDQTLELEEPQSDVSTTAVGPASTPGAPSR